MAKLILEKRVRKTKGHLVRIDPAVLDRIDGAKRHGGKGVTGVAAGCLFDPNDPYWNSDDEDL